MGAREPSQRLAALRALSHYRLGYLETIQLDRALSQATAESPGELSPLRLALLASSKADHLKPSIRIAGLRRGLLIEIYLGTYGQYRQELLDSSSRLHRFKPQFVLFSLTAREFLSEVTVDSSGAEIEGLVARYCGELSGLWQRAREGLGAGVVQQTFFDFTEPLFGGFDRQVRGAPARAMRCSTTAWPLPRPVKECCCSTWGGRAPGKAGTPGSIRPDGCRPRWKSRLVRHPPTANR